MYLLLSKFFLVVNWQPVAISVFRCAVKKPGNASFSRKKMKVFSHSQSQCRKVSANPGPAYISYPHWQFQTDCLSLKMLFCLKNNYKIISWKINNLHYLPKNTGCLFFAEKKWRFFRIHNHNVEKSSPIPGPAYKSYPLWLFQTDCLSLKIKKCCFTWKIIIK